MAEVISSAIALPDAEDLAKHADNKLKRRTSQETDDESSNKRQRTSPGKTSPRATTTEVVSSAARPRSVTPVDPKNDDSRAEKTAGNAKDARKRSATKAPDEKQRSKRLFGALLGNLNRPSDRTSRRRAEIEQRKKAELQKQDDERLEDRQRRLERLAVQRKKEQIKVDEHNLHVRHQNLLNHANFLQTRAEPKLYYRPWDLLPDEEDLIEQQIKEVQTRVDRELAEWEEEKRTRLSAFESSGKETSGQESPNGEQVRALPSDRMDEGKGSPVLERNGSNNNETKGVPETDAEGTEEVATEPMHAPPGQLPADENADVEGQKLENANNEHAANGLQEDDPQQHDIADQETHEPADTTKGEEPKEELDEDGDHLVEGDEDNVIY